MKTLLAILLCTITGSLAAQPGELLKINGTELYVRVIGSGPPIVVVHGGPGLNHDYFLPHLLPLAKTHKLVFYDQRACGQSSGKLDSMQMTMSWLIKDIEGIRSALGLGKITLMAHSWGGLLGMRYAVEYPQSIERLILVNTVSPRSGEFEAESNSKTMSRFTKEDSTLRANTIKSDAFRAGDVAAYTTLFKVTFRPSFYNRVYADSINLGLPPDFVAKRKVLFLMAKELGGYDHYPLLKNIRCPTLIIHGDYDAVPVALSQKIQQHIKRSELKVMTDAGHFPFIEKRQEFVAVVSSFMTKK